VQELQATLNNNLTSRLLAWFGGQFENLASAKARMQIVIPLALMTIFVLLMAVFHNFKESLLVFSGVPFALSGGLVALWFEIFHCRCQQVWVHCALWCRSTQWFSDAEFHQRAS
jgi:Cu/Ag efflux pump CusA